MSTRTLGFGAALALVVGTTAFAWESQLYPKNATSGKYAPATINYAGRNWRLLDYSYAGYRLGTQALASGIPCAAITITGSGDIATELQNAINQLGANGGGTVLIPAGTYTLSRSIQIPYSNVSVAGAGSGRSFIDVPSSYTVTDEFDEGVFTFGKPIGGWTKAWPDLGDVLAEVSQPVAEGATTLDLASASAVTVGQWVVLAQYFWPQLSQLHSGGVWPSQSGFPATGSGEREAAFIYLRQVTAKSGNRVTLDAPIPRALNPANNPIKLRAADSPSWIAPKTNLGIAGLTLRFADNHSGADGRPRGMGVFFEGVRDGWIYDLKVRNAPRYALYLNTSARITVLDSGSFDAQDFGEGGYASGIEIAASQNILVKRSYFEEMRHGITARSPLSSLLVFTQGESAAGREVGDDTHWRLSHGVLWDDYRLSYGTGLMGLYRGSYSNGAHESNGGMALWNLRSDGWRGSYYGNTLHLNPASDSWSIAVGPTGLSVVDAGNALGTGEVISATSGLQTGSVSESAGPGSRDRNALYEGVGQSGLTPASLYETQLLNRLGAPPADFSTTCRAAPVKGSLTPTVYNGAGALIYNSDHLGYSPRLGSGCTSCDLDSRTRNATAGGAQSAALTLSGSVYAIGLTARGPTRNIRDYDQLKLSIYPTQANLQLRLRLSHAGHPEGSYSERGDYILSGLTAGQWNAVSIPMTQFHNANFNSFEIRSNGSASTGAFYVDDVLLTSSAPPAAACADGLDNDSDGKTDFPADPGCSSAADMDEYNAPPAACADGADNDADGKMDYPADPGCASVNDNDEYNPPQCSDGMDNDADGRVDYAKDPGCSSTSDNDESPKHCQTLLEKLTEPRCK